MAATNTNSVASLSAEERTQLVDDLRAAAQDFENPGSTEIERDLAKAFWESYGAVNRFSARLLAGEIARGEI